MKVTWQSVRVGSDFTREEDGQLVFIDGKLVAILVCRSDEDEGLGLRGVWSINVGFGPISGVEETFLSFENAVAWILRFKNWEYLLRRNRTSH